MRTFRNDLGDATRARLEPFGRSKYTCEAAALRFLNTGGNMDMGSASSAPKYCTTSSWHVRAPSHFSFAVSVPTENILM